MTGCYYSDEEIADMDAQLEAVCLERDAIKLKYDSAISTLKDIAAMSRKVGSETARHRLTELGIDVPDYQSMT